MTRRKSTRRRVQQAVAAVTHTADTADVIEAFKARVAAINVLATEGHAAIKAAGLNDHRVRIGEVNRVNDLRKHILRERHAHLADGYRLIGITPLSKRLPEGYEYVYLPIVGTNGMADTEHAEVLSRAQQ